MQPLVVVKIFHPVNHYSQNSLCKVQGAYVLWSEESGAAAGDGVLLHDDPPLPFHPLRPLSPPHGMIL